MEEPKQKSASKTPVHSKQTSENIYGEKEIRALIAGSGDFSTYSRLSGLINDILREQKLLFMKHRLNDANTVSMDAEEFVNKAALYASEDNYKDSFNNLGKAFDILAVSVSDLRSRER
jgi:methylase of polypeptide subunit release factors